MGDRFLYSQFYDRVIQTKTTGIKLVPGGTGLGKTRGISEEVQQDQTERKYIYGANRVQLLDEMEEDLRTAGIPFAHLRRNRELVQRLLDDPFLRREFYSLLDSTLIKSLCADAQDRYQRRFDPRHIHRLCEELRHTPRYASELMEELLDSRVRQITDFWRTLLRVAADDGKGQVTAAWYKLIEHPVIHHLFPYLHFKHDPSVRVLLVTIQKLYRGFFDGRRMVDIFHLTGEEDGGRVIFLDEFDFLETNLIDLLCEDIAIRAPFRFVEQFYRTMTRDRLPLLDYPVDRGGVRQRIERIITQIENLQAAGIAFPELVQFICESDLSDPPVLFQTNRTILEEPLFLEPTKRAWRIVTETQRSTQEAFDALDLFHTIHHVTYQILHLFKSLEGRDQVAYQELRRHCFAHTVFYDELPRIQQLPEPRYGQPTGFDSLLATGYGLYELHHLQQETDPTEVDWRYFSLFTTPEAILATLAEHNLVFGLSATANLPRYLGGFNMEWLEAQEGVKVHPIEETDRALIQTLNARKQAGRANTVEVVQAGELERGDPFQRQLIDFIEEIAAKPGFGGDDPGQHRKNRVQRFFRTLLWIADQPAEQRDRGTHLLFFTSYRQIEYLFQEHPYTEDVPSLWEIRTFEEEAGGRTPIFRYYELDFVGASFIVIFYNAARAQQIERDEASQAHFNKAFWQGKPVVLITTYPSAGNGVNLQYLPTPDSAPEEATDFGAIHLLDSPYYYFSPLSEEQSAQERHAAIKKNVWYLAKLFEAKLISEARFRRFLANVRQKGLNDFYRQDPATAMDALLNRLATFIQAVGRIERVWHPVPNQVVRMSRAVWETFEIFSTQPEYEPLREQTHSVLSNNLMQILNQVTEQTAGMQRLQSRLRDERLPAWNRKTQEAIGTLLSGLVALRAGQSDQAARDDWEQLRRSVLRHDFQDAVLHRYHCVFETSYMEDGVLYLTQERYIVPKEVWDGTLRKWTLNQLYGVVSANDVTRRFFERQGYELAFRPGSRYLFTPYCYQAILAGAIGEEGIRALLHHEGVPLEALPDALFELADLKVTGQPWYIDCKNYSERTLESFPLPETDPAWRPALNEPTFQENARHKLSELRRFHIDESAACKLIYLNLTSPNDWVRQYYNAAFEPVSRFEEAAIIVIPGVLQRDLPNAYTRAFTQLLPALKRHFLEEE